MSHCSTLQLIHSPPELSSALVFNWSQFWPQLPPLSPFTADCHGQTLSGLWSVFCGCCLHYVILVAAFSYSCYFSCCAWFSVLAAITLFSFCLATGQVLPPHLLGPPSHTHSLTHSISLAIATVEKLLLQHHFSGYKRTVVITLIIRHVTLARHVGIFIVSELKLFEKLAKVFSSNCESLMEKLKQIIWRVLQVQMLIIDIPA